jgi:hypothetical protein
MFMRVIVRVTVVVVVGKMRMRSMRNKMKEGISKKTT